jgi:hypothetical protein
MLFPTLYGPDSKPAESRRVSAARIFALSKKALPVSNRQRLNA